MNYDLYFQMDSQILNTLLSKLAHFRGEINQSGSTTPCQYFQHMRWDFVVDEDFNVFLLEANDSPYFGLLGVPHYTKYCRDITGKSALHIGELFCPDIILSLIHI